MIGRTLQEGIPFGIRKSASDTIYLVHLLRCESVSFVMLLDSLLPVGFKIDVCLLIFVLVLFIFQDLHICIGQHVQPLLDVTWTNQIISCADTVRIRHMTRSQQECISTLQ